MMTVAETAAQSDDGQAWQTRPLENQSAFGLQLLSENPLGEGTTEGPHQLQLRLGKADDACLQLWNGDGSWRPPIPFHSISHSHSVPFPLLPDVPAPGWVCPPTRGRRGKFGVYNFATTYVVTPFCLRTVLRWVVRPGKSADTKKDTLTCHDRVKSSRRSVRSLEFKL